MGNTAKAKHTPGPWEITTHGAQEDGMYMPIYTEYGLWISEAKGRGGIQGSRVGPNNNAEIAANAALIAAAPELLAALCACLPYLQDLETENIEDSSVGIFKDYDLTRAFNDAKAAIEKATL